MAQRRMFSPDIVSSDAFLEMSATARDLYFQLGMFADDDGFVSPRKYMRMLGSSEDDLKILLGKRFLLPFESGVLVVKHWRINNFVRKDRYRPTNYIHERNSLYIKDNMAYTLDESQGKPFLEVPWKSDEQARLTTGQPDGNQRSTQVRLGKDRLDVVVAEPPTIDVPLNLEEPRKKESKAKYPNARKVFAFFPEQDDAWNIITTELKSGELLWKRGEENVLKAIKYCFNHIHEEGFPIPRLTPYLLISNWKRISDYAKRNG